MRIERRTCGVEVRAPAKVNLFLEVLGKRPDGFHEIATLMVAVSLYDVLDLEEAAPGTLRLECHHPTLTAGSENLVLRAARLLQTRSGTKRGAAMRLTKRIPLEAGLGGGSSDAAAVLAGLNELWQLHYNREELARLGGELGSDVPFFFSTPAAWCTGRGEIVTPVQLGRPLEFVLIHPGFGLATAAVYRGVQVPTQPLDGAELRRAVAEGNSEALGRQLHNRLQPAAEQLNSQLTSWLNRLRTLAPAGVAMSGSGSTLFALCRDRWEAIRIARELRALETSAKLAGDSGWQMFLVRSCL